MAIVLGCAAIAARAAADGPSYSCDRAEAGGIEALFCGDEELSALDRRLVAGTGPVRFTCDGDPRSEVVATFFPTEPPTVIAERGDSVSLMDLEPSASGARYQGRNESLWEHEGEALIVWGYGSPEMRCTRTP
jgi:hypothetical protein